MECVRASLSVITICYAFSRRPTAISSRIAIRRLLRMIGNEDEEDDGRTYDESAEIASVSVNC